MASTVSVSAGMGTGVIRKTADASGVLSLQTNSTNALTVDASQNVILNSIGGLNIPSGTTAQRPSVPVNGMLRYNTTIPQSLNLHLAVHTQLNRSNTHGTLRKMSKHRQLN